MPVRHFSSILDVTAVEMGELLQSSLAMKHDGSGAILAGQVLALVFEKPSLRTRVSMEMAMHRLGGRTIYLGPYEVDAGNREPVRDIARVLSGMVQAVAVRTHAHEDVTEYERWATVPVINALSEREHPCQALADMLTLTEHFGSLRGIRLAYLGEGNNIARSLAFASALAGIDFRCASPEGYGLSEADLAEANAAGEGVVTQYDNPHDAVRDAAAVYTDVWASMGEEHKLAGRVEAFRPFSIDAALLASAPPDALIMHDLPAHRGEEITDEAIESPRSVVFEQAENRMHTLQAVLAKLLASQSG